jgi:glycosyltransferase involved in cell wall biosynthesis
MEAIGQVAWVVYVDSGSTDGSLELARSIGAHKVELDLIYTVYRSTRQK